MLNKLKPKVAMRSSLGATLLFTFFLCGAQTTYVHKDPNAANPDAQQFLNDIFELYAHATFYHIESVEETTLSGQFSRLWTKSLTVAIVGPGNQFRFETQGDHGSGLQVSDGKTEWIYSPTFQQYIQHLTPSTGPTDIRAPGLPPLTGTHNMPQAVSGLRKFVRTAVYAPDESIPLDGMSIACRVIKTEGDLTAASPRITIRFTFWIDNRTHLIRRIVELREGPLRPLEPDSTYAMERTTVFPVVDLAPVSTRNDTFTFTPPLTASQVERFEDQMSTELRHFVGKQAPDINLRAADGNDVSLKSLQGKPVLLDFWATWCAGCIYSLPRVENLYRETAKDGLVLLSIDQNEEPAQAAEFWSKHNEPWLNFHASADTLSHFPRHGIPYFVLIDTTGVVVFSGAGLDEEALRAAIAKLGPTFASVSKAASP